MQAFRGLQFFALGYAHFGHRGYAARKHTFTPGALDVDLSGRHYVVTGASSGLGRAAAEALAARGGTVHLVCRGAAKAQSVADGIAAKGGNAVVHICDLSSLKDVERFAQSWGDNRVDCLVNNAGVLIHERKESADGFEVAFATNTLGTFTLTELLRPALASTPGSRVITVSSAGMLPASLETEDFQGEALTSGAKIDGSNQYANNKRQQVALTEHWSRKYAKQGIFWAAMHPGWAKTPGVEKSIPGFYNLMKNQMRSSEEGADTIVWLAAADEAREHESGKFFFDRETVPTHMWGAGTQYTNELSEKLASKLRNLAENKGIKFQ